MPEFFATSSTTAALRQAHAEYTHVVLNRRYQLPRPVFFKSGTIIDLPIFMYAPWDAGTFGSRDTWREKGGILIDRGGQGEGLGAHDAQVFVECPFSRDVLNSVTYDTRSRAWIPKPVTWSGHEEAITLRIPSEDTLRQLRAALHEVPDRAQMAAISCYPDSLLVMTDSELVAAAGIPVKDAPYLRGSLRPDEVWQVRLRLPPEHAGLLAAWEAIKALPCIGGSYFFTRIGEKNGQGWRRSLREMARMGYITALKAYVYPIEEPDYAKLERKRAKALKNFRAFQEYVESLPVRP